MRASRLVVVAALFFAARAARAQSEGVAEFKGSTSWSGGRSMSSTGRTYFTGGAYRAEWEMDLSAIAVKGSTAAGSVPARRKTVTIQKLSDPDHALSLNENRHTYAISDLKKLRAKLAGRKRPDFTVKKLGRDKVAGYACRNALVTSSSGTETELCVATDLAAPLSWLSSLSGKEAPENLLTALRANGLQGLPIRLAIRSRAGQAPLSTMELVRFEKKPLEASLFEIPAGYTETDEASLNLTEEQEAMMKELREKMKSRHRS